MLQRKMDGYPVHSMPNYDFLSGGGYSMKQFVLSNSEGDSSSTKSEQSRQDLSAVSDSSLNGQHTPKQSADNAPDQFEEHQDQEQEYTEQQQGEDNNDSYVKRDQGMVKSVLPLGNPEAALSPPKFDYNQPFACITYPYAADPYYGGVLTGYASNAIVHPQLNGTANSRVPLPVEPAAEEPVFVNVKQYHAILRRRQMRAKLEAQNKLVKGRKPYLHESRHCHAMKRARGSGGRFLTKKELQEQQQKALLSVQTPTGGVSKMALGKNGCPENSTSRSPSTPTSSGISSVSNGGGMLTHQEHISFSSTDFLPSMNFSTQNGGEKRLPMACATKPPS
ncbi:nuclear transcription factor Y subunit A-7-like isoform X1 [Phragmites australis]|uniref:nuclear transcription factor Y subunit A-7-like isoform X1 n=1 Tax=Phragmites australis TaxID=29695 RepID=UPI002D76B7E9|nr:nuclear transcription factor Y subunit A-7-like isoform X1 [Phragmites australis]XP_062215365.1 nuclear transcription factor Y subunit A-7-like isoform X1 [Phragmites australis]